MKMSRKVLIGVGALVLLAGAGWFTSYEMKKGVVTVQTGQVAQAGCNLGGDCFRGNTAEELHERGRPGHRTDHRHRG